MVETSNPVCCAADPSSLRILTTNGRQELNLRQREAIGRPEEDTDDVQQVGQNPAERVDIGDGHTRVAALRRLGRVRHVLVRPDVDANGHPPIRALHPLLVDHQAVAAGDWPAAPLELAVGHVRPPTNERRLADAFTERQPAVGAALAPAAVRATETRALFRSATEVEAKVEPSAPVGHDPAAQYVWPIVRSAGTVGVW
ncbi:hypothetical protein ONZ51_g10963 [Trametes cubensis]|uniref:Uncharacterized protein n=1 Tax=Trametes cubensis TaxID=1111947 RepID=A0AAD7TIF9_9APHY|nr:hypothetical protein ONZ51_g10963 [Trametes cubensis]